MLNSDKAELLVLNAYHRPRPPLTPLEQEPMTGLLTGVYYSWP